MFSSSAGPFSTAGPSSSAVQTPFQRLKPVCVELLSLTGRTTSPTSSQQTVACLRRLKATLHSLLSQADAFATSTDHAQASSSKIIQHDEETTLPPSLINYVFYPLSELICAAPKGITSLPDSIAESVLEVLALLCSQWWTTWSAKEAERKGWQTWCDLVILASSVIGSPTPTTNTSSEGGEVKAALRSDEVKQAAVKVLYELLSPRFRLMQSRRKVEEKVDGWEWDGVSELPCLDEITAQVDLKADESGKDHNSEKEELDLIVPTWEHFKYATTDRIAKGAISFVLSSCFTIAESSQETTQARKDALGVARNALLLWIGGTCTLPPSSMSHDNETSPWLNVSALYCLDIPSPASANPDKQDLEVRKVVALRLRPLLPGITSSLTRLTTSRLKSRQDGSKHKPTPSAVVAESIGLLGDLLRATLSDACLIDVLSIDVAIDLTQSHASTAVKVNNLEDFARFDTMSDADSTVEEHDTPLSQDPGSEPESTAEGKEVQWTLSTLAQVHLALKTFSPLTAPSLAGTSLPSSTHPAVQTSMLRLAAVLLTECSQAFGWLDKQLDSMARLDPTSNVEGTSSVETILTWVLDLASTQNSISTVKNAKAAFEALQKQDGVMGGELRDGSVMWKVLIAALDRLTGLLGAGDDAAVSRLVLRVSTILTLLSDSTTTSAADLTKLVQDLQHSSLRLLRPLKVEQLTYVEESSSVSTNATWRLQPTFSGLEASTSRQLSRMFCDFGRSMAVSLLSQIKSQGEGARRKAEGLETFGMITHLIELAGHLRSIRLEEGSQLGREESVVCLVVANEMLCGVAGVLGDMEVGMRVAWGSEARKQVRRVAHKLGKKVSGLVMDVLDGDAEEASSPSTLSSHNASRVKAHDGLLAESSSALTTTTEAEEQTLVEKVKGISLASTDLSSSTPTRLGPVLDLGFVRSADLTRTSPSSSSQLTSLQHFNRATRDLDLSNSLLFSLLSSASRLLGQSFRPLLLRSAYPLVSAMSISNPSVSSDVVREASRAAMRDIAFNTAYGDVKNCLLDHADYILGAACQRLIVGLDEELRSLALAEGVEGGMEGIGEGQRGIVVPLVSAQRAPFVLVEMIRVLGSEVVPMVEDAIDEVLDALDRFHGYEGVADGLLGVLGGILECMAAEQASNPVRSRRVDVVPSTSANEVDDFKSWLAARGQESKAFDDAPPDDEASTTKEEKEEEDKPTKSQQVTAQILTKSTFFLTHPSSSLRVRVLDLLRHGILTLAPQARTAELLPIVNSAWPFVMTCLGLSYSTSPSTTSKLSPIIDLSPTTAGGSAKRDGGEAWMKKTEENLVEKDVGVWFAAAKYVEAAVEHAPDFVGKRVVDDAWPRFELLLRLVRARFDPRYQHARHSSQPQLAPSTAPGLIQDFTSKPIKGSILPQSHTEHPFIHPSSTTLPAQLTICIITTLTSIVHYLSTRMPDEIAWSITTHPSLLEALDTRQPPSLVRAAEGLYKELGRRNSDATRWALRCAFPKAAAEVTGGKGREGRNREGTPCFMVHTRVQVHSESMHCVLEGM